MAHATHPVSCERVRAQVSLELDGELSQLERAMLSAHVLRCGDCRAHRREVRGLTAALRAAPLEPAPVVTVRRYRRGAVAARFQAGVAAAMAFAVVGVASQMVGGRPDATSAVRVRVTNFQTQQQLELEQALIERGEPSESAAAGKATAR